MTKTAQLSFDTKRGERILFIAMVVISYVITLGGRTAPLAPPRLALLIGLGVVYALLGIYGALLYERSGLIWAMIAYFAVLISLGATILYLSGLGAWLLMLPLAGSSVEWLPRRWMLAVCALIWAAMALVTGLFLSSHVGPAGEPLFPFGSGEFWTAFSQNTLAFTSAIVFVVLFMQVAMRERQTRAKAERLTVELRNANRQLREYAAQAEELATAQERNRMAREIHDGLGHYLTAINMQIQAGRAVLEHNRALAFVSLDKAQTLAKEGLAEVRRSVSSLRASPLDNRSLLEAIAAQVDECRAAGVATSLVVRGEPRPLPPQIKLALYRTAQEGLTNICKHAQASSAEVILDYLDLSEAGGAIRLTVHDSGVGSDDPNGGYGLVGIRERMHMLGGQVQIETAPGEGFTLKAEIPVPVLAESLPLSL